MSSRGGSQSALLVVTVMMVAVAWPVVVPQQRAGGAGKGGTVHAESDPPSTERGSGRRRPPARPPGSPWLPTGQAPGDGPRLRPLGGRRLPLRRGLNTMNRGTSFVSPLPPPPRAPPSSPGYLHSTAESRPFFPAISAIPAIEYVGGGTCTHTCRAVLGGRCSLRWVAIFFPPRPPSPHNPVMGWG